MELARHAACGVAGPELDDALAAERAWVGAVEDIQAEPAHGRVEADDGGPGRGMPGSQQVRLVMDGVGAEPRPHELLGRSGPGQSAMKLPAAVVVGRGEAARAGTA